MQPRRQALLKRPDVAKVINLDVDPESYWIYTNTAPDRTDVGTAGLGTGVADAASRMSARP